VKFQILPVKFAKISAKITQGEQMKYDFDAPVERGGTYSSKWKTSGDELPMWVADMDFKVAIKLYIYISKI